jgi:hypothetical protein
MAEAIEQRVSTVTENVQLEIQWCIYSAADEENPHNSVIAYFFHAFPHYSKHLYPICLGS